MAAPVCLGQGRLLPVSHEPKRSRGPGPPCPQQGPWPQRQLNFLGFSADLIIVVNADGDEKEAAGQEQQDSQGHEARLG